MDPSTDFNRKRDGESPGLDELQQARRRGNGSRGGGMRGAGRSGPRASLACMNCRERKIKVCSNLGYLLDALANPSFSYSASSPRAATHATPVEDLAFGARLVGTAIGVSKCKYFHLPTYFDDE